MSTSYFIAKTMNYYRFSPSRHCTLKQLNTLKMPNSPSVSSIDRKPSKHQILRSSLRWERISTFDGAFSIAILRNFLASSG